MTLPDHLGGHKGRTHLDAGVLDYMIQTYNIKSFIDIGCGPGGMVNLASEKGLVSLGIDGDYTVKRQGNNYLIHDYTLGISTLTSDFDMAWSCEFVEHVSEEYIPNYLPDFQRAKYVVMTFSEKGGHHHVNIKPKEYWIEIFNSYGFIYDKEATNNIKLASTMNTTGKFTNKQYVKANGLFFYKK
tara:strand:- start:4039 stop:4593 length:555 start_codon:yes stop_codon:yes gene_type:complete